jgi:hypothetical protein
MRCDTGWQWTVPPVEQVPAHRDAQGCRLTRDRVEDVARRRGAQRGGLLREAAIDDQDPAAACHRASAVVEDLDRSRVVPIMQDVREKVAVVAWLRACR